MGNARDKITLDRPAVYEIRVPGSLDESWLQWNERMTVRTEGEGDRTVTTLTCALDQAALQGMLRRLYAMGIPLISAICLEDGPHADPNNTT